MGFVLRADAAVVGTAKFSFSAGISKSITITPEPFGSLVLFVVRPVNFSKLSVLWAFLLDVDFVVFFEYDGV